MSAFDNISAIYSRKNEETKRLWNRYPGIGTDRAPQFHPTKLALTTGDFVGSDTTGIIPEIRSLSNGDKLAETTNESHFHFSFLSITLPLFGSLEDLTDQDVPASIFDTCCAGHSFAIKHLRLVALPNSILLAGIPDEDSLLRRTRFVEELLASAWQLPLMKRYEGTPLPPPFWHSTLIRHHTDFLPGNFREFFFANESRDFGSIILPIRLLAATFDWKNSHLLR